MSNSKLSHQRRGSLIPPSMSQTLWSTDCIRDSQSTDEKGVNVQVILRCRPQSEEEIKEKIPVVINCNEIDQQVSAVLQTGNKQINRNFVFDKVFAPSSQQEDLYNHAVAPVINEALQGYSCTIFAYGQTGTGKTYTMEGEGRLEKSKEIHKHAGVIPRAVQQIFDILESQNAEYSIKVTFIELYNEEITDLLASDDSSKLSEDKPKRPIALMEDGKGNVFIRGLEEEIVTTAEEIHKIVEKGSAKKHKAETLLNKQSNRSHSIFSITVHIKECTPDGLELVKCGKLNLVDLAGSENILRSGAKEGRAREAGEVNKSLLTLGRVIHALVDNSGHVPYRDSKLTRLLRDSLGGKTKTCIIATVSPSAHCLEETLSTLDYAYRAKNIRNRPEINQKVLKSAMMKDLNAEIDRLKKELHVTQEKNGIYISRESYLSQEVDKKALIKKCKLLELDLEFKNKQMAELQDLCSHQQQLVADLNEKLEKLQTESKRTKQALSDLEDQHGRTKNKVIMKEHAISNLLNSENALTEKALEIRAELESAASEVSNLLNKIDQQKNIQDSNRLVIENIQYQLAQDLEELKRGVAASMTQQEHQLQRITDNAEFFMSKKTEATNELRKKIQKLKKMFCPVVQHLDGSAEELSGNCRSAFGTVHSETSKHAASILDLIGEISREADLTFNTIQSNLNDLELRTVGFLEHEHKRASGAYQETQLISEILLKLFKTLIAYFSRSTLMGEESLTDSMKNLFAFRKKFEEFSSKEDRLLLAKVAELLANSNAEKNKLVEAALHDIQEELSRRSTDQNQETSNMQVLTKDAQEVWTSYIRKAESNHIEDTAVTEAFNKSMEGGLKCYIRRTKELGEKWRKCQESIPSLQSKHNDSVASIINAIVAGEKISSQLSCIPSSLQEESDVAESSILLSIEDALKLDHDMWEETNGLISLFMKDMKEMEINHAEKTSLIKESVRKLLLNGYMVEQLSTTPRRKRFSLPSIESIENLKTPKHEKLQKPLQESESVKETDTGYVSVLDL